MRDVIRLIVNPIHGKRSLQYWSRTRAYHGEPRYSEIVNDPETKAILMKYGILVLKKELTIAEAVRFADFEMTMLKIETN
jgi:hypothetical protein